jgi:hypothetical protein
MATIGKLAVQITADTTGLKAGLNDAERTVTSKADAMAASINKIGAVFAALGVAATLKNLTIEAINAADAFDEMAERTGVSVEKLSTLSYAAKVNGATVDDLGMAIKGLSNKMMESLDPTSASAKLFDGLGVSVKNSDGTLRAVDDVLMDISDRFSAMPDGAAKSALSVDLFTRAGLQMIPVLNKGRNGLEDLRIEAERMGAKISTETAKQMADFNDNMTRLAVVSGNLGKTIANSLVPELNKFIDGLLAGIKHSNGFWDTLSMLTQINPFKDLQGNLKSTRDDIDGLTASIARQKQAGLDSTNLEQNLADVKRRLEMLKEIERQQVLNAQGKDNESPAEGRRLGLLRPTQMPAKKEDGTPGEDPLGDFMRKQEEAARKREEAAMQRNANLLIADQAYFEQKAEALRQSTLTQEQIAKEAYTKEIERAKSVRDAGLITQAEYDAIEIQAAQERSNALQAIEFARMDMITAKENEAAQIRKDLADKVAQHDMDVRAKQANMVVGILNTLGQKNKVFALASIALQTKMALAQNSITTAQAGALAFASQLIPGDPTSLARAAAAKAAVMAQGGVTAGLIMASGGLQAASLLGGGGESISMGGSATGSSGQTSSMQTMSASSNIAPQTNQVITIQGISSGDMFTGDSVRGLIDQLIEAQRNGSKVVLS